MVDHLKIAKQELLEPADLNEGKLQQVLYDILTHQVDYADLYFQANHIESWALEESIVKHGSYSIARGVGIRALSGVKTGFAYADEIELPSLQQAAIAARSVADIGTAQKIQSVNPVKAHNLYLPVNPLKTLSEDQKVALLHQVDQEARAQDKRISQVMVSLSGIYQTILVIASDGTLAADIRPLVSMSVSVIAEEGDRREHGSCGGGSRVGYEFFFEKNRCLYYAREAARQAIVNLSAVAMPAGVMPVILGPGWPGVLLHEAVGHGLEGDFNRKKTSMYADKIGKQVASQYCTVVDDGTLKERRGSMNIDDEGVLSGHTVLIEKGILKGYMQDKFNARLMGMQSTGNGRRENYANLVYPRMTNTYLMAGECMPEEIIASVDKGLYAMNFSGGQVDITSGKFVFSASEAYLIEKGKITQPVKGATLIGSGPEVLNQVSMVGNNLQFDLGIGVCGKEGQSVEVGVGQPTIKVDAITVGGTG